MTPESIHLRFNQKIMRKGFLFFLPVLLLIISCKKSNPNYQKDLADANFIHGIMEKYTDIIVHDIFSPPVASRNYTYASIAAYEAARHADSTYKSLEGQIKDLKGVPQPDKNKKYSFELAAIKAMFLTCKKYIFSEADLMAYEAEVMKEIEKINVPQEVYKNSLEYGEAVAKHIMAWSDKDNYKESRSFPKFSIDLDEIARWRTTPPAYMDAVEPHWNEMRTLVTDSAQQFKPIPATPFDTLRNSKFMKEVTEVYEVGKNLSEEQKAIANFWDCNPYKMNITGHVMHATKKISPGGHWINIATQVLKTTKADFVKTTQVYALVSMGLYEGFISCWDEKYRSNLIRPESIINEYIDQEWRPMIQTPPFPEYTSGHSVVSAVSSTILTSVFGDNYAFTDSTEVRFGLEARSFKSFYEAADQASISRLYGGIHYRPAIENGAVQGKNIANYILEKVKFK